MTGLVKKYNPKVKKFILKEERLFAVDIKTSFNITDFGCFEKNLIMMPHEQIERLPEYMQIANVQG